MEEKQLYGVLTVYRERGAYLRRLEQFDKSKAAYDEAFKAYPEDVPLLIGRSQVCSDAVKPKQAYADAELALKNEHSNMQARNMQARALYTMSDFEKSLVMNYRGYRMRRQPPYFSTGISQGTETIEDCIGKNAGNVMLDFLPLIKESESKRVQERDTPQSLHQCRIPQRVDKQKMSQTKARNDMILSRVLAMKYLGPMSEDKFFLKKLKEDPRLNSANSEGSEQLKEIVSEALRSLTERQEMLRSQRPYYSIKLAEKTKSNHHNEFLQKMIIREREAGRQTAERLLRQLKLSLEENRINDLMTQAERMQSFLDKKTNKTLPGKDTYIDKLYRTVGRAYLTMYRLSYALSDRGNRHRIAFLMGIPVGRPKSFDSVLAHYPYKFIDIKRATEKTKDTLDLCENATQRCWLYYEMARLQCMQKNFALCKFYAKRCQREAQDLPVPSTTWWLNGCFAVMSADMQQKNASEIRAAVDEALQYTKNEGKKFMRNPERLVAFLTKCAEVAADLLKVDDQVALRKREQQILSVMGERERVETELLLRSVSTVPAGRRFTVLPRGGGAPADRSARRAYCQRGLTVVPGPSASLRRPPRSPVPGLFGLSLYHLRIEIQNMYDIIGI